MSRRIRPFLIVCLVAMPAAFAQNPPGPAVPLSNVTLDSRNLRVHFIDVGPGLAVLIETPHDRQHYFVDGGKWGVDDMMTYVEHFVPEASPIDVAIVTHADSDHYKGMRKILAEYDVLWFLYSGYTSPVIAAYPTWTGFLTDVEDEEGCESFVPLSDWVAAGDKETIDDGGTPDNASDDVVFQYLNVDGDPPERDPVSGRSFDENQRRNNASLVIKVIYGNVSFLITGDINGRKKTRSGPSTDNEIDSEELELWTRHNLNPAVYSLKSTVLQAPHHGSNGSCSRPFIQAVDPEWIVITAGHEHDHPSKHTLDRLSRADIADEHILRTDEGDSTPEVTSQKDPRGDDSFIFETDGATITKIWRVKM